MSVNLKAVVEVVKWLGKNGPAIIVAASKLRKAISSQKRNATKVDGKNPELKTPQAIERLDDLKNIEKELHSHVQVINNHTRILKEHHAVFETHADNMDEQAALIERLAT